VRTRPGERCSPLVDREPVVVDGDAGDGTEDQVIGCYGGNGRDRDAGATRDLVCRGFDHEVVLRRSLLHEESVVASPDDSAKRPNGLDVRGLVSGLALDHLGDVPFRLGPH
jgi:hypothetical protein